MLEHIWNPWHGCIKYSEGCEHCYMYYLDAERDKNGSDIYKVKTNFNLPIKKKRDGSYKIESGETIMVCLTSDFFLEQADEWREEAWNMIRQRTDVNFWLQTKRAERVEKCLPKDWGDGWDNVSMTFTAENQRRADERIPILLTLPFKRKRIMCAPMIGEITLDKFLSSNQIDLVLVDDENYDGDRPLHYEWVKKLYDECLKNNVNFDFVGIGNYFIKDGKTYNTCKAYQKVMAQKSGLQIPSRDTNIKIQRRCASCKRNASCNGCKWCGKCR